MAMKLRKSQVFVHTSVASLYLIHCICLHEDLCDMPLYCTLARQHLPFHGSPLSLLIFGISLATTVVDVARHQVDYKSLVIARCPDSFASSIVCRSPALSLWQASKLLFDTLSLSLSSNVLRSTETCTATPPLQSYSPWPQLTSVTITLFVWQGRLRLDTRLALYLAGTAAVEDWVMRAAALLKCI